MADVEEILDEGAKREQMDLKRMMEWFGLEEPFNQGHFPPDQVFPSPFDLALSEG